MAKKNIHVVPKGGNWAVKSEGSERASKVTSTQKEAIEIARDQAKNNSSEMFIHGANGRIRERNTYGKDECPPKG